MWCSTGEALIESESSRAWYVGLRGFQEHVSQRCDVLRVAQEVPESGTEGLAAQSPEQVGLESSQHRVQTHMRQCVLTRRLSKTYPQFGIAS